jgi:hypothetical protein
MARSYAIFSTGTGKAEFEVAVGLKTHEQPGVPGESPAMILRDPKVQNVGWTNDDVLTIQFDDGAKAFRRVRSGRWTPTAPVAAFRPEPRPEVLYGKSVTLSTLDGTALDTVSLSSYFGPEPGVIQLIRGLRRAVLFKVSPPSVGDSRYFSVLAYSFKASGEPSHHSEETPAGRSH